MQSRKVPRGTNQTNRLVVASQSHRQVRVGLTRSLTRRYPPGSPGTHGVVHFIGQTQASVSHQITLLPPPPFGCLPLLSRSCVVVVVVVVVQTKTNNKQQQQQQPQFGGTKVWLGVVLDTRHGLNDGTKDGIA